MSRVRLTKVRWINGQPYEVGATVNLKPRLAADLIQIGAAMEIDTAKVVDAGSTPARSTKSNAKKEKTDGSSSTEDKGEVKERTTEAG